MIDAVSDALLGERQCFVPTLARSAHSLRDTRFYAAVQWYAQYKQEGVTRYMAQMNQRSPHRD